MARTGSYRRLRYRRRRGRPCCTTPAGFTADRTDRREIVGVPVSDRGQAPRYWARTLPRYFACGGAPWRGESTETSAATGQTVSTPRPLSGKRSALPPRKVRAFRECAAEFIEKHRAGWRNAKHRQQWENTLAPMSIQRSGNCPCLRSTPGLSCKCLIRSGPRSRKRRAGCAAVSKRCLMPPPCAAFARDRTRRPARAQNLAAFMRSAGTSHTFAAKSISSGAERVWQPCGALSRRPAHQHAPAAFAALRVRAAPP